MYIMFKNEDLADDKIELTGMYWHYEIYKVKPEFENTIDLSQYGNAVVVPDHLAYAFRFLHADKTHALTIRPTANGKIETHHDLLQSSLFDENNATGVHRKQLYYLTENDKQLALEFLKIVAVLHIRDNTPVGQEDAARALRDEILIQSDLLMLRRKVDTYFDVGTFWPRKQLDKEKIHKVDYKFHGHHIKKSKNV